MWSPDAIEAVSGAYEEYCDSVGRPMPWTDFLRQRYRPSFCGLPRTDGGNPTLGAVRACLDQPAGCIPRRIRAPSRRRVPPVAVLPVPVAFAAAEAAALSSPASPPIDLTFSPPPSPPRSFRMPPRFSDDSDSESA